VNHYCIRLFWVRVEKKRYKNMDWKDVIESTSSPTPAISLKYFNEFPSGLIGYGEVI